MGKLEIVGTIRTVQSTERRKKDVDRKSGKLVVMNEDGEKVVIEGKDLIITGFNPEDEVKVTITRANMTLGEAIQDEQKQEKRIPVKPLKKK